MFTIDSILLTPNEYGTVTVSFLPPELFDKTSKSYALMVENGIPCESGDDLLNHFLLMSGLDRESSVIIHRDDLLPEDLFRMAWKITDGKLAVDMDKAAVIKMADLRKIRDDKLAALDVPYMKALERGVVDEISDIVAKKNALRDLPETIDLSVYTTAQELKDFIPAILKEA